MDATSKADKNIKIKTFAELEAESRVNIGKSLDESFGFIKELTRDDWFTVYINSIMTRLIHIQAILLLKERTF